MKRDITVFIVFGLTFIILSLIVMSQVLQISARARQAVWEVEQQHALIKASQTDSEYIDEIEASNRAIEKGIVILSSNEKKLRINIFLLIANGILSLGLASRIFWIKRSLMKQG